jgi:hypothetical protein
MNALWTYRGRRFLPLLAMGYVLTGLPLGANAGMLSSRLTDRATLALASPSPRGLTARIVYQSQGENQPQLRPTELSRPAALAALALISIIPAGTLPVISDGSPPPPEPPPPNPTPTPPPPPPPTPPPPTTPGGGHIASTPEPGTLMLALTGCGSGILTWLRRRRANSTVMSG